jgi:hypothetical protein
VRSGLLRKWGGLYRCERARVSGRPDRRSRHSRRSASARLAPSARRRACGRVSVVVLKRLLAPNLREFRKDPIVRFLLPTTLYRLCVEAEAFLGLCSE